MSPDPSIKSETPRKVLIIDDNASMRLTLSAWLVKMGYTTTEAATGIEGIDAFKREKFDIVISDILMPGKNGLETISEVRSINTQVKIIAISGAGINTKGNNLLELATEIGAHIAIAKPFGFSELKEALKSVGEEQNE